MRAAIGDPEDKPTIEAFAKVLRDFCAVQTNEGWGIGVSVLEYRIGDQKLTVFSDSWNVDIDGPDALVKGIEEAMQRELASNAGEKSPAPGDDWSKPR